VDGEKDFGPKIAKKGSYVIVHMNLFLIIFIYVHVFRIRCTKVYDVIT
jgi:hypothetical protein